MDLTPEMMAVLLEKFGKGWAWVYEKFWEKPDPSGTEESKPRKGLLVIGPGGTGKTTFAKLISGQLLPWVFGDTGKYDESFGEETFTLSNEPNVQVVVPAGQAFRRESAWADVRTDIASGRYSGVVFVVAFGHHTPSGTGYKSHPLYKGKKDEFLVSYTATKREEELAALEFILPALETAPEKLWLMTLATKQDLWWKERATVEQFYTAGRWADHLAKVRAARGPRGFAYEFRSASITLSNLKDSEGTVLFPTTEGYDVEKQATSVKDLFNAFDALRNWEDRS